MKAQTNYLLTTWGLFIFYFGSLQAQDTYLDNFNTSLYSNNNGTQNFSSDWIENNDDGSPTTGSTRITSGQLRFRNSDNDWIYRFVPLAGAPSVTLTLDYDGTSRGGEIIDIYIYNSDTAVWNLIDSVDSDTVGNVSYDLTAAEIASNPAIIFYPRDTSWGGSDTIYIDNVLFTVNYVNPIIVIDDVSVNENGSTLNVTATHIGANASSSFTVNYTTINGTAISGSDYTATTGTLTFNGTSGDTETISIPISNDGIIEGNETFIVSFTSSSDGSVDISDSSTVTILDDDALIITDGTTTNTCSDVFFDTGGISGSYTNNEYLVHTICPDVSGSFVQVDFTSFDVESGYDFLYVYEGTSTSGALIGQYHNGNIPTTITATDSTGCLTFLFDSDGSIVDPGWEAEISCYSPMPTIVINDVNVDETSGAVSITATHENVDATGPFTVNFSTSDQIAQAPLDYTLTTGTLSFNGVAGDTQTITIPIIDDGLIEQDETFTVQFTATSDSNVNITDTATVTINSQIAYNQPLSLYEQFAGYIDYTSSGGSFRTADNATDPCVIAATSSGTLVTNIPATSTIQKAYLYWAHSSYVIDDNITFEGQSVAADIIYESGLSTGAPRTFYGYVSDVTSIIQGIGAANLPSTTFDVEDLTIDTSTSYCDSATVLGGWSLMIFYEDVSLPAANINLYLGFDGFDNAGTSFTLDSFYAIAGSGSKASFLSWDGDADLDGSSGGSTNPEELSITNQAGSTFILNGDGGQTGNNAYNSTIYDNTQSPVVNISTTYGLDWDTYDITSYIGPTDSQVTANVDVGQDFVISNAVVLKVPSNLVTGYVFEDLNYPGGAGRDRATASGIGIQGATVELYNSSNNLINTQITNSNGQYTFGGMPDGTYSIRVVNSSVSSSRAGGTTCGNCIPVQTFRSYNTGSGLVNVTNEVGGANPSQADSGSGTISGAQSISQVALASNGVVGIDFGFNFNTIVNTNEDGQGSLEQFIVNSNNLDETVLDIEANGIFDPTAGEDVSIFMIPTTSDPLGRSTDSNFSSGYFDIFISNGNPLTDITANNTAIDGRTQTAYSGDTNSGSVGSGGTAIGVSSNVLPLFDRPEIQIHRNGGDVLRTNGSNVTIRNVSVYANNNAGIRLDGGSATISSNLLGVNAIGVNAGNIDIGIENTGGDLVADGNYIATNTDSGIVINGGSLNIIQNNQLVENGDASCDDNILINGGSGIVIQRNLIENAASIGIDAASSSGILLITENTITGSGQNGGNCGVAPKQMGIELGGSNSQITNNLIHTNAGAGIATTGGGTGNLISQNSFYSNGTSASALGIDLAGDGVTINDSGDGDVGSNNLLNFPIIENVTISGSNIMVKGWAPAGSNIEFYYTDISEGNANAGDNMLGNTQDYGEGEIYIGSFTEGSVEDLDTSISNYSDADGNTDSTNRFRFLVPMGSGAPTDVITATATVANSTSEFSPIVTIKMANVITNRRITYRVKK